jgi:hypothetical protein
MDTRIRPLSAEWKKARMDAVTGTDLGKILGLDPGCSRQKLLKCKKEGRDCMDSCKPDTRFLLENGKRFEQTVQHCFSAWIVKNTPVNTDTKGFVPSMHVDRELEYFTGSPDFIVPGIRVLAEFKTHFHPNVTDAYPVQTSGDIKLRHYLQVQAYLRIMDYTLGYLVSWTLCHGHTVYVIIRDDNLWKNLVRPAIEKFWDLLSRNALAEARMGKGEADANAVTVHASLLSHCVRAR